jgi:hypothetical protein
MRSRPKALPLLIALLLSTRIDAAAAAEKPSAAIANAIVRDLEDILDPPARWRGGGHHVWLQTIELEDWDSRYLTAKLRLRYQKTRGFPHFSTSGAAHVRLTIYPGNNGEVCVSDYKVVGHDLNRVPKWLDNAWLEKKFKGKLPGEVCAK